MKALKIIKSKILLAIILFISAAAILKAQDTKKDEAAATKELIASKHFVFNAESVLPTSGKIRFLTNGERVDVNGDSLTTDLPYFGRAYSVSAGSSSGGFHFTSTEFEYTVKDKKKGGWTILIKPKDNSDVQQMTFDISTSGMTSLQVISNNRQAISFNGHVAERKKNK